LLFTFILSCSNALAQESSKSPGSATAPATAAAVSPETSEAQTRVSDAVSILRMMKSDAQLTDLIQKSKGLLIVPHFFKAALLFGGYRGAGVMLVQTNGRWSDPAFYKTSNGSFGAQIGGAKGAYVLILTSDKAVQSYAVKTSSWSMNAGAGLTAAHYSKDAVKSGIHSDVVVWSDTTGLFGGASLGASRVASDERANQAYYNQPDVTPQRILSGLIANPYSNKLREALPMQRASEEAATAKEAKR
jgi:lipid-binding SYLF domain-containing protein